MRRTTTVNRMKNAPTCSAVARLAARDPEKGPCHGACIEHDACVAIRKRALARVAQTPAAKLVARALAALCDGADALRELLADHHGAECDCPYCIHIRRNDDAGGCSSRLWDTLLAMRIVVDDGTDNVRSSLEASLGGF